MNVRGNRENANSAKVIATTTTTVKMDWFVSIGTKANIEKSPVVLVAAGTGRELTIASYR